MVMVKDITHCANALIMMGAFVACTEGEGVEDVEYNIDAPIKNIANPKLSSREQCYGVALAQFNDCATAKSHCAGTASLDYQSDRWKYVERDMCQKIGGSLKPKKDNRMKSGRM